MKIQKNKKQQDKGFTLVELMVVVIIISVLASLALPAYTGYTRKAKITEGLLLAAPIKMAVTEYALDQNTPNIQNASNAAIGVGTPTELGGKMVDSITVESNGTLQIVYKEQLGTLLFVPTYDQNQGRVSWQCSYPTGSPMATYAPKDCTAQ